jgi:O-antigen/teichoic acid export membrane protein
MMAAVSPSERERIVSGMRWTVWLSVLATPFGYGTTVLLARVGPEVLGMYGLLMVYIGVVSSLLYFGGDAVAIQFVPGLQVDKRLPFLASYFVVACACLVPWLAVATVRPRWLHYIFGEQSGATFQLLTLYMAPIYIASAIVIAGLKAVLDMRSAQILSRSLTVGTFAACAALYIGAMPFLRAHYTGVIWCIYLGLTTISLLLGLIRLVRLEQYKPDWRTARWFLPPKFWRFAFALQQASALGFLLQRLDLILVLNLGGLELLGKYVAILSLAGLIQVVSRFFLDTLLPALTNLLACRDISAASDVFATHLRILFVVSFTTTSGLMFLVQPLTRLLGPQYAADKSLFVVMILLLGLAAPGAAGGTLLTALGKQQRSVWVGMGQLGLFVVLFFTLWPKYRLLGAVLATGVSTLSSNFLLLITAKANGPILFPVGRDYFWLLLAGAAAGLATIRLQPLGVVGALIASATSASVFVFLAGYRWSELRSLACCLTPGMREPTGDNTAL